MVKGELHGVLAPAKATLNGILTPTGATLHGVLTIRTNADGAETYDGTYSVRSQADEAYELPTANRYLTDNITVEKIPYYETSNLADGLTVYIGKEIEVNYG